MDFTAYPTYFVYRSLAAIQPWPRGYDVYALQTALEEFGFNATPDGIFGPQTGAAVKAFQKSCFIGADGVAGPASYFQVAQVLCGTYTGEFNLPINLLRGQIAHESSDRPGNYSKPPRPDGSYDAGMAQRNTAHTPASEGFDAPASVKACAKSCSDHHSLFAGVTNRRRWGLAAGAWNAPAYACWIANEEGASVPRSRCKQPSSAARAKLEDYIASVTALAYPQEEHP